MQIELRNIQQTTGVTTILVTHDQTEAMALSDRIAVMHGGRIVQVATPFEAYEFPASGFVSSFLGKTNLIPATATVSADGTCVVAFGDTRIESSAAPAGPGPVLLSVRPEKLRFAPPGAGHVSGTVRTGVFLGNQWLYQVESRFGDLLVVHQNTGAPEARTGDRVGLAWDAEQMRLLPADD